jgi:hypothetical protein
MVYAPRSLCPLHLLLRAHRLPLRPQRPIQGPIRYSGSTWVGAFRARWPLGWTLKSVSPAKTRWRLGEEGSERSLRKRCSKCSEPYTL